MLIGVPAESMAGENRVAATPETVKKLKAQGHTLQVQSGGPITAFGTAWPNDSRTAASTSETNGGGTGWLCVQNCTGNYANRVFEYSPRGAFGSISTISASAPSHSVPFRGESP